MALFTVCGAQGEMVLSVGKAAYLALHGAGAGVIDISPFTCMNGIVSEAITPSSAGSMAPSPSAISILTSTQSDLDRDLGIYLELARSYRGRNPFPASMRPASTSRWPEEVARQEIAGLWLWPEHEGGIDERRKVRYC